jgi:uncharacterized protein (DUF427 family)
LALTLGAGPLSPHGTGKFNFDSNAPSHLLYFEDSPRRVRVVFNGETIADSRAMKLLHESNSLPVYYFPIEDVHMDLLEATDHSSTCPVKGDASYWSIKVGNRTAENAVWSYLSPLESAPWLEGYAAFYWDRVDAWFEEDEQIIVHPRDPYHRVDVLESSRKVKISINDEVIVESDRPKILFETGLPPRYYIPESDVRTELLVPSDTTTQCPYKGTASYWSVKTGDEITEDVVWYYPDPLPEVAKIAGHLCLFNERVDVEVDGESVARPETPFSRSIRGSLR